jgi:hypothetical protein
MTQQNSKPRFRPVIHVFVSSTVSDLKPERNALQAQGFPSWSSFARRTAFSFRPLTSNAEEDEGRRMNEETLPP